MCIGMSLDFEPYLRYRSLTFSTLHETYLNHIIEKVRIKFKMN